MHKPELLGLTGIRFYAALLVYLSHVVIIPGMETLSQSILIFNAGVVGVSFFFVLSGFILTYNYAAVFSDGVSASSYKQFVLDRLARIYPVHLLALLMVAPIAILSPNFPLDWRAVPFHLLLLQSWWPSSTPPFYKYLNVPSWSISCEWFFYILAPMAIYCAFGNLRRWGMVGITVGYMSSLAWILLGSSEDSVRLHFVSWFAPTRFLEFVVGVFLARLFLGQRANRIAKWASWVQVAGIFLVIVGALYRQSAVWPLWGGLLYVPGSALLILGLAYGRGPFVAHLSRPWLKRLGMASFAFYMIHGPLLRTTKNVFFYLGWEVKSWPLFWGVAITLLILIQIAALPVYCRFETPIQRRLRTLTRRH